MKWLLVYHIIMSSGYEIDMVSERQYQSRLECQQYALSQVSRDEIKEKFADSGVSYVIPGCELMFIETGV